MNFTTFLQQAQSPDLFYKKPILYFYGAKDYPLLFFSFLFGQIKKNHQINIQPLDLLQDQARATSQLETSFLGQQVVYWIKNIDDLPAAKKKQWLSYFNTYAGPNFVMFFCTDDADVTIKKRATAVRLPQGGVDSKTFVALMSFFENKITLRSKQFIAKLFKKHDSLSLDTACLFMSYVLLSGANTEKFFATWLDKLVVSETSLFTLSQHFFAKNIKVFMKLWSEMADNFPPTFWVTFWSEQLWRAYHFVNYSQQQQFAQAKRISYRLPFSFMQRDWRKSSLEELQHAHQKLYEIDVALKNSAGTGAFDLFFSNYFLGHLSPK